MPRLVLVSAISISLAGLGACATVSEGSKATVAINAAGVSNAACTVSDAAGKRIASVRAPGQVILPRGKATLTVACQGEGRSGSAQLASSMADKAKVQMPTGYLVDAMSGAMWTYPAEITVEMRKAG